MSGGKQSLPRFEYAEELVNWIGAKGLSIVLLTSRPIDIYSNIYRDTIEWLRFNGLGQHLLLWSKAKAEIVFRLKLIDRLVFAVDDEYKHCEEYAKLGVKTYWLNHYKLKPLEMHENIVEIFHLSEIIALEGSSEKV